MKKKTKATRARRSAQPYVVVRCTQAGVHAGLLVHRDGQDVTLRESRRLWHWRVPMGAPAFLSGVAMKGLDHGASKVGCTLAEIALTEACEVMQCSPEAEQSIRSAPDHVRTS